MSGFKQVVGSLHAVKKKLSVCNQVAALKMFMMLLGHNWNGIGNFKHNFLPRALLMVEILQYIQKRNVYSAQGTLYMRNGQNLIL